MFETFDHTADLGLRIWSETLDGLFAEAGRALFAVIVEDISTVRAVEQASIEISGSDREYLLFDWLKQLLFHFDGEHRLFSRFEAHVNADGLKAEVWGERLDLRRHALSHEVKAITYHGLKVEQRDAGWLAEVIVDI